MSYKLFSLNSGDVHNIVQWNTRTLEGELKGFENRTVSNLFEKYLQGRACKVLEGGCGFGAWCEWFIRHGHAPVGLEYNPEIVQAAKLFKSDVPVELGDVTDIQYPDKSFDAYISLGVIEHFEHGPEKALLEAKRILKTDGLAFISTPYLNPIRRIVSHPIRDVFMFLARLFGKKTYYWEYRFTENELVSYIKNAGFEIVEVAIDDYPSNVSGRHIGLYADWFFLRNKKGQMWELNAIGKAILAFLRIFPEKVYCSAIIVVAKPSNT